MTSYITLLSKIEAFCNAHLQIKKYGGEFREQMPNFSTQDEKYPIIFVTPTSDTEDLNTNQFTIDVYCVDVIQKDRANLNTILSDTQLILKDLYVYYKNDNDADLDVIGTAGMTPLNNLDLDYVAGWVMSITFEVSSYGDCAIPMNPIVPGVGCAAATVEITDDFGNVLYSLSVASGATQTQVIADSTVTVKDSANNTLHTVSVNAEGIASQTVSDSTYTVEYVNGTPISSGSILAEGSAVIQVPNPIVCANTLLEVNGTSVGSVSSGSTVDIQLSDSGGVVTPTSVTQVGNDLQIVLPESGAVIDPDAQAFLTATGLVADNEILAVNTFVTLAKAQGIWNDLDKAYPFIGGTASLHRYNLKNSLQDGTFFGGVTHNASGVTFNGTTGYFDTAWATTAGNVYNRHFSQYISSQTMNTAWAGSYDGTNLFGFRTNAAKELDFVGLNSLYAITPVYLTRSSVMCVTIDSNTVGKIYSDGGLVYTNGAAINATPTTNTVFVGALNFNGTASFFHDPNVKFVTTGNKLDASKQAILNNLVRYFNSILGR